MAKDTQIKHFEYNPMQEITYELAKEAARIINEYRKEGVCLRGPQWVWPTFDLEYVLQEWRMKDDPRTKEFEEEYEYIHTVATFNWHMYEDREY